MYWYSRNFTWRTNRFICNNFWNWCKLLWLWWWWNHSYSKWRNSWARNPTNLLLFMGWPFCTNYCNCNRISTRYLFSYCYWCKRMYSNKSNSKYQWTNKCISCYCWFNRWNLFIKWWFCSSICFRGCSKLRFWLEWSIWIYKFKCLNKQPCSWII